MLFEIKDTRDGSLFSTYIHVKVAPPPPAPSAWPPWSPWRCILAIFTYILCSPSGRSTGALIPAPTTLSRLLSTSRPEKAPPGRKNKIISFLLSVLSCRESRERGLGFRAIARMPEASPPLHKLPLLLGCLYTFQASDIARMPQASPRPPQSSNAMNTFLPACNARCGAFCQPFSVRRRTVLKAFPFFVCGGNPAFAALCLCARQEGPVRPFSPRPTRSCVSLFVFCSPLPLRRADFQAPKEVCQQSLTPPLRLASLPEHDSDPPHTPLCLPSLR